MRTVYTQQAMLTRLDVDGSLCPRRLAEAIRDPAVVAVYAQSLSYTDGTCDDLVRILEIVEIENCRRVQAVPARRQLVTTTTTTTT